ncbi:MAG: hypothetical protein RLZZ630_1638 [Bacteroidota bacterium]
MDLKDERRYYPIADFLLMKVRNGSTCPDKLNNAIVS